MEAELTTTRLRMEGVNWIGVATGTGSIVPPCGLEGDQDGCTVTEPDRTPAGQCLEYVSLGAAWRREHCASWVAG